MTKSMEDIHRRPEHSPGTFDALSHSYTSTTNKHSRQIQSMLINASTELFHRISGEKNTQASVHRLPTEIIATVLETGLLSTWADKSRVSDYLISISAVCSFWRDISIENPRLWTKIEYAANPTLLRIREAERGISRNWRDRTTTYLERSKRIPLCVRISARFMTWTTKSQLLETLGPSSYRIAELSISLGCRADPDIPLLFRHLPSLRSLQFSLALVTFTDCWDPSGSEETSTLRLFPDMSPPLLSSLIVSVPREYHLSLQNVQSDSITTLTLSVCYFHHDLANLLQKAQNLKHLELWIEHDEPCCVTFPKELPSLISFNAIGGPAWWLLFITDMPRLQHAHIQQFVCNDLLLDENLAFPDDEPLFPHLRSFSVGEMELKGVWTPIGLGPFIRFHPSLEFIQLIYGPNLLTVIRDITGSGNRNSCLKLRLMRIICVEQYVDGFQFDPVVYALRVLLQQYPLLRLEWYIPASDLRGMAGYVRQIQDIHEHRNRVKIVTQYQRWWGMY